MMGTLWLLRTKVYLGVSVTRGVVAIRMMMTMTPQMKKLCLSPPVLVANEGVAGQPAMGQRTKMRIARTAGTPLDSED